MHSAPDCDNASVPQARRFASRGVKIFLVVLLVSLVFALVNSQRFWTSLVYSTSIALACWLFIDAGRLVAARWLQRGGADGKASQWPGWGWMTAILVGGTFLGYTVGNAVANLVTGHDAPGIVASDPRQALALLVFALIPGLAATYFFYSRERIASGLALASKARREAAENQLRLLESQLEPHMLFNTLANLRVLIGIDPPRAQAMLDQLIAFLRATLHASRVGMHPLSAEFARLADYLALMKVRMGERLQARFDLPEELAAVMVPPLLLQPLVENCIKHGLEPQLEGGRIDVCAAREGTRLVLRMRDTGVGLAARNDPAGSAFGLAQVRERLATLYGERASLDLGAADGAEGGTLATIRLPLHRP